MQRIRLTHAIGLPLAVAGLAACGGTTIAEGSGDEIATLRIDDEATAADDITTEEPTATPDEAALEFSQCLRDRGLDVADIGVDADGNIEVRSALDGIDRQDESVRAAMQECRPILEAVGFGGGRQNRFDDPAVQDAFLEFSECIRDQGFEDVPDLGVPTRRGGNGDGAGAGQSEGDLPPDAGQGQRGGDFGDRATRIAERLELDPEDPVVVAAVDACLPILEATRPGQPGDADGSETTDG